MRTPLPLLATSLLLTGCIEAQRRSAPETTADTVVDSLQPTDSDTTTDTGADTGDADDTSPDDDTLPEETTDTLEADSSGPPCLPAGCLGPSAICTLVPGFCWIDDACVADGELDPENTCRRCDAEVSPRAWKSLPDASDCNDGLDCTNNDICRVGSCKGVSTCTSSFACLTPTCDPAENACVDHIDEDRCFIRDACYSRGQTLPNRCKRCEPSISQTELTPGDGHEPDDSLEQANALSFNGSLVSSGLNSDSAWNGPWTTSTLSPLLDIDAFVYIYLSSLGSTRPLIKVDQSSSLPIELCVYIRCLPETGESTRPTSTVTCGGTDTKKTVDGWVGCCRTNNATAFEYAPSQAWCERNGVKVVTNAEAGVTVRRTTPPAAPDCHDYTLRWGMR